MSRQRILAVASTRLDCYRELLTGIVTYANAREDWDLQTCDLGDAVEAVKQVRPEGVLLGSVPDEVAGKVIQEVSQVVGVCGQFAFGGKIRIAEVESDDAAVGALGAAHFLEKGFQHFAYLGPVGDVWSDWRRQGYEEALKESGRSLAVFNHWTGWGAAWRTNKATFYADFLAWLAERPKPLALLVCNDLLGRDIIYFCRMNGVRIPEDVSVLGVDNDALECALANPPLSSIAVPWRALGRLAAELLGNMFDGKPVEACVHRLKPTGVVERQSTALSAVPDRDIGDALRFIQEHAHEPISVEAVARAVSISRRMLERRFRALLGRSPADEIRRVHLDRAKTLLAQSELSVSEVASLSGFNSVTWFCKAFHDEIGQSPTHFRRAHGAGSATSERGA